MGVSRVNPPSPATGGTPVPHPYQDSSHEQLRVARMAVPDRHD